MAGQGFHSNRFYGHAFEIKGDSAVIDYGFTKVDALTSAIRRIKVATESSFIHLAGSKNTFFMSGTDTLGSSLVADANYFGQSFILADGSLNTFGMKALVTVINNTVEKTWIDMTGDGNTAAVSVGTYTTQNSCPDQLIDVSGDLNYAGISGLASFTGHTFKNRIINVTGEDATVVVNGSPTGMDLSNNKFKYGIYSKSAGTSFQINGHDSAALANNKIQGLTQGRIAQLFGDESAVTLTNMTFTDNELVAWDDDEVPASTDPDKRYDRAFYVKGDGVNQSEGSNLYVDNCVFTSNKVQSIFEMTARWNHIFMILNSVVLQQFLVTMLLIA